MADSTPPSRARRLKKTIKGGIIACLIACSIGNGQGSVIGELNVPDCWTGAFNLNPDFFAAIPYNSTLQIRVQQGNDLQIYSDGLSILVDNVNTIRGNPGPSLLGVPLAVSLPVGVTAPGYPVIPNPNPSLVHAVLYLQESCQTQYPALYAVDAVTLDSEGGCNTVGATAPACDSMIYGTFDAGTPLDASALPDAAPTLDAGGGPTTVGRSQITFTHLFNGIPQTSNTNDRLTTASFDLYFGTPNDPQRCPGSVGVPLPCRAHLTGNFSFYYQSGSPAQPFPQ